MKTTSFSETQRFRQPLVWLLLGGIMAMLLWAVVQQIFLGKPFGTNPMPDAGLLVLTGLYGGFVFLFTRIRLETRIDSEGIHYRMFPFNRDTKHVKWDELKNAFVREYNPISEYGGWGYRSGMRRKNGALNISGKTGLQLVFNDDTKLLLGTRRGEELGKVIAQYIKSEN